MIPAVKTLAAINAKLEADQESGHRAHLGASVIGDECARAIWYKFRWTKKERFEGRMLRLFLRGHREESIVFDLLRSIGVEVWDIDPETKKQFRISDVDGHFGGSLDAVIRGLPDLPDEAIYCEVKTHNDKSFKRLQADGVMKSKWKHFVQFQTYMFKMRLNWGLYIAINKNDDDLFMELFQLDSKTGPQTIHRAEQVIWAIEPPPRISTTPAAFGCKFCSLQRLCHFGDVTPDRNCRTCKYGSPGHEGDSNWICWHPDYTSPEEGLESVPLNEAAQIAACPKYSVNPLLQGRQP